MKILPFILLLGLSFGQAQNTIQLAAGQTSPKATLNQVSWLVGHWQGEAFGGIAEEIWSPPLGESMMFVFRLVNDGKVSFYESGHIKQVGPTLLMQLKHFHGDLRGWEEKDETVDFKLVKLEKNKVFFEGLTIEKVTEDRVKFYVLIEDGDKMEEIVFNYARVR
ncbi:DUF6265 family protein [Allomuricauda sp. SCSIO 65647]|uniref:DUF6265 family protein n=1 Tax=Allomuricauda sp. SCSIO 65647 TaxID=2908843 RepID=UPI001F470F51|nr:DUF6265 family protein [Muricauda sp. SCSIO 65647]UJH68728.1 DUF6265 family protein [Muricauda sp. SCSIO 65647]